MGGFRLKERTAVLRFSGTEYDGAEVRITLNVKLGVYRKMVELKDAADFDAVIEYLCGFIKDWNLEDDDGPIPPTPEGFDRLSDLGFLNALLEGWEGAMKGVTEVAAPLENSSNSGITFTSETPSSSPEE
jgi:hypothetical protein